MTIYGDFEGFPLCWRLFGVFFLNDPSILKKLTFKTLAAHVDRISVTNSSYGKWLDNPI